MTHQQYAGRTGKRSYLILGGAIVLGVLVGLGIGMALAGEAAVETEVAVPAAAQEIYNDWYEAWDQADGQAVVSMMAPAGRHYCPATGSDGASGDELAELVDKGFSVDDIEIVGAVSMSTPGDSSDVSQDHVLVTQLTLAGHEGYISTLHLRGQEDSLRVLSHRAFP